MRTTCPVRRDQLIRRGKRNLSTPLDRDSLAATGAVTMIDDPDGLLAEARRIGAGGTATLPDVPEGSPGCYTMVLAGTCHIVGTEIADADPFSMIHRTADDPAISIVAGTDGVTILSMRFPHQIAEEQG